MSKKNFTEIFAGASAIWTRPDGSTQSVKVARRVVFPTGTMVWEVIWKTGPNHEDVDRGYAFPGELNPFPAGVKFLVV